MVCVGRGGRPGPGSRGGFGHEGGDAGDVAAPAVRALPQGDPPAVTGQALLFGGNGIAQGREPGVEDPYTVAVGGEAEPGPGPPQAGTGFFVGDVVGCARQVRGRGR